MKDRGVRKCNGECGKAKCRYGTIRKSDFTRHIRHIPDKRKKKECPHCGKKLIRVDHHIRRKHPDKYVRRKIFPCPFPDDPNGWVFVKRIVSNNESADIRRKHRWSEQDREELIARNSTVKHEIAIKVYNQWKSMGDYDDAGGYVKGGLHLRSFSLHKLSLDRINNDRPHYIGNELCNLNFVSSGINTQCNIVSLHGGNTCAYLRERSKKPITESEIQIILKREKSKRERGVMNVVYSSCAGAYYKDGQLYFKSLDEMFTYVYDLLVKQRAICLVTNFLMDEHAGTTIIKGGERLFKPSLNAKIPSLGHKPGNLEWVCAFVNATDHDKKNDIKDGVPTGWLNPIFKSYIGI